MVKDEQETITPDSPSAASPELVSGREMCEFVIEQGLWDGTAEELWNSSPTGELSHVFELYWEARAKQAAEGGLAMAAEGLSLTDSTEDSK